MAKSYEIVWNDLLDQQEIKFVIMKLHEALYNNGFVDLRKIEKIIIHSIDRVDVITDEDIKHYRYHDDSFRKGMVIYHTSEKQAAR